MVRNFPNMIDYVKTQLDTFAERDVCRVDSLVFSLLSYFRLPEDATDAYTAVGLPLKELYRADWFDAMCGKLFDPQSSLELLSVIAASPRFRDVRVSRYVSRTNVIAEQQFAAMTFSLSPCDTFIAFRGTDDTLVGWKEDFNLSFQPTIPSQVSAARYLDHLAEDTQGRIWCGGHSKGGNLAVYAGVMCQPSVRGRMVQCFSHDGPGFSQKVMEDPRWEGVESLVDKTIPQSSVIGMILERQERSVTVVHSHSLGFNQHDPFSWEVDQQDFLRDEKLVSGANLFDSSVNAWLQNATEEERERFVDAVFSVLAAAGEPTMAGIRENWRVSVPRMASAAAALDPQDRELVMRALRDVFRVMMPPMPQMEIPMR